MDIPALWWYTLLVSTAILLFSFLWWNTWRWKEVKCALPPGPPAWPLIGNLFQLGKRSTQSLFLLSQKYGPLMTLRLGMKTIVVVSSPAMAKEILKTHDQIFAGRSVMESAKALSQHKYFMSLAEYGAHWKKLRRISNTELFSNKRLQALEHMRRDQVFRTIRMIFEHKGKIVNIGHFAFCASLNLLGNMILSRDVFDPHDPVSVEFKDSVWRLLELSGRPNMADYFPFLRHLDPQGLRRQTAKILTQMFVFFDAAIHNRMDARKKSLEQSESHKDFLDVLLDLKGQDFTFTHIRALIADFFFAGAETTTTTVEWAMAELLRNPDNMARVREELDETVGMKRRVEESDIDGLPYLHAVVKEVLRLHPTTPLLLPHKAESSCEVGGFFIPKDTQVTVNVWAIGRDPAIWKEPLKFMPERFLEGEKSKIDYKGQNFELIPFGAGRRICVGLPLATRMVLFQLASLLQCFEWAHPDGMKWEETDMSDKLGVTLKKAEDLNAIATPRLPQHLY